MDRLFIPQHLDAPSALEFTSQLSRWLAADAVVVDFSNVAAAEPFGMLLTGESLRAFFRNRQGKNTSADGVRAGDPVHEYLAHLGFFHWLGLPVGKSPGAVEGGANWMPITILNRTELEKRMNEMNRPLGHVVQVECEHLARLLTRKNEMKVNAPLAYCLREVIRNVFEHAETNRCAVCAQKLPNGSVELSVVDAGRGIRASLAGKHSVKDDADALELALRPGVSRNLSNDPEDPWGNSGFGLYVLSDLGGALGTFRIASGEAVHTLSTTGEDRGACIFHGTAVQLRLKPPKGVNFADFIAGIVAHGEKKVSGVSPRRASRSTTLNLNS